MPSAAFVAVAAFAVAAFAAVVVSRCSGAGFDVAFEAHRMSAGTDFESVSCLACASVVGQLDFEQPGSAQSVPSVVGVECWLGFGGHYVFRQASLGICFGKLPKASSVVEFVMMNGSVLRSSKYRIRAFQIHKPQ